MKHHIIVKYTDEVNNKNELHKEISSLFAKSLQIEGIHSTELFDSVIDLPNRYDLMIVLTLDEDALERFDRSEIHAQWKRDFSQYIQAKTIFDCE